MSHEQNHIILGRGDLALDAWGRQVIAERFSLFHSIFTFDVPKRLFRGEENGVDVDLSTSTNIVSTNGMAVITTDGNNGDVTILEARRHPRYQPDRAHHVAMSIGIPVPESNAIQDWGMFTDTNGVFFRCDVDGKLYACIMSGGILTHKEEIKLPDEFTEEIEGANNVLDITKGNNYDIQIQWRGVGSLYFYIEDNIQEAAHLVHKIKLLNTLDFKLSIENPALPIAYRVVSLGDADGLWSGCADITSSGGKAEFQQYYSDVSPNASKSAQTSPVGTPVISIFQPLTINGEINTRDIELASIIIHADKRGEVTFYTTRDPTAFTGDNFTIVNDGSFVESDSTATAVDEAKLIRFGTRTFQANLEAKWTNPDKKKMPIYLVHGDFLVIVMNEGVNVTIEVTIEWGEEI